MYELCLNVLVVDDEKMLSDAIHAQLKKLGEVSVKTAETFDEAISVIESDWKIDFLLTDFHVHGKYGPTGADIAAAYRRKYPKGPILLMSGDLPRDNPKVKDILTHPLASFIEKPFSTEALEERLYALIGLTTVVAVAAENV